MPLGAKHRGVAWVGGREIVADDLRPLAACHANWISQTPFGWQRDLDSLGIRLATRGVLWGETDIGLETTARLAHDLGMHTLLKPHIWVRGQWRGEIRMPDELTWQQWFRNYRTFILHYARFAQRHDFDALCIGTELYQPVKGKPQEWRQIIREVRNVYDGKITYAANWHQEFRDAPF